MCVCSGLLNKRSGTFGGRKGSAGEGEDPLFPHSVRGGGTLIDPERLLTPPE